LTYPAIVSCVGVGVVMFLSTKTLPDLVGILRDAGVEPPGLTLGLMTVGRALWQHGVTVLVLGAAIAFIGGGVFVKLRPGHQLPRWTRRLVPACARRALLARAWSGLAELLRTGVPLIEAMRITAPTVGGLIGSSLAAGLRGAADAIERGSAVVDALADDIWFDDECRRLVSIGESAGELPDILSRLAERSHRSAVRSIDRLASVLEPAVILLLAVIIGFVVMGAVLPILRLQEIIG
jgi:type II secretory pathway component PulF